MQFVFLIKLIFVKWCFAGVTASRLKGVVGIFFIVVDVYTFMLKLVNFYLFIQKLYADNI